MNDPTLNERKQANPTKPTRPNPNKQTQPHQPDLPQTIQPDPNQYRYLIHGFVSFACIDV